MIETNIGKMPVEDYLEIWAMQHGFDSYEEYLNELNKIKEEWR